MRSVVFACTLLLSLSAAAQNIDDKWITERVLAGRSDELRKVEAESDRGSPVAMYWWGAFLVQCVFRCDEPRARELWMKAALAGHGSSKAVLIAGVRTREALDALVGKLGQPASFEEKVAYVAALGALATPRSAGPDSYGEARTRLRELAAAEPRMGVLFSLTAFDGPGRHAHVLRAMVD